MKNIKKALILTLATIAISGCKGLFEKDNTEKPTKLESFKQEVKVTSLWKTRTNSGVGKQYLKLNAALTGNVIYTSDTSGTVTATNQETGKKIWAYRASGTISSGPTVTDNLVIVSSKIGEITALSQKTGAIVWRAHTSSEVLARPSYQNGIIVVKAIDGKVLALSEKDGRTLWTYHKTEPNLILRAASAPAISDDNLVVGFANGTISKLTLAGGSLQWQTTVAIPEGSFAIERMVDIDADPIIYDSTVYVATYQGRIAAIDLFTGKAKWSHDLSSYTGMAIDKDSVFITDAKSDVWNFNRATGKVNWRQKQLAFRNITGPLSIQKYIVVGDTEGYLHLLDKKDGHFVARERVNKHPILTAPIGSNKNLYAVTTDGYLAKYTIS